MTVTVKLPDAVFIVDIRKERIALAEAKKLGITVIAIVDTNCDPEGVDFPIPGNDDAIRSIRLFTQRVADLCLEGQEIHKAIHKDDVDKRKEGPEPEVAEHPVLDEQLEKKIEAELTELQGTENFVPEN